MLDTEQQIVVNSREGIYALLASPGSGKTTTVIARYKALLDAGIPARDILCLTFTKEAAKEMEKRAGKGNFRTFHSFAYSIMMAEAGKQNLEPELRNRLLAKLSRKWHVDFRELVKFISSMKHKATSPSDSQFYGSIRLAKAYDEYEQERNRAGWIDFEDMLMDAIKLLSDPCVRARYQFKYCHPPGVQIAIDGKYTKHSRNIKLIQKNIEDLDNSSQVIAWDRLSKRCPVKNPQVIQKGSRHYQGILLNIKTEIGRSVSVTPNHYVWVRMTNTAGKFVIYLMWKNGVGFRIGVSKLKRVLGGNGFWQRCRTNQADKGWILRVVDTKTDALFWEEYYGLKYRLPEHEFPSSVVATERKKEEAKIIFSEIDTSGGIQCLQDCGLLFDCPAFIPREFTALGIRPKSAGFFRTHAINILPGLMRMPLPEEQSSTLITEIEKSEYDGPVYSLEVPKYHTYVANGLIVGNCMIDEAQDSDICNWKIAEFISEKHKNILSVGDKKQAMYQFRSAVVNFDEHMKSVWPQTKVLHLSTNYRSTPPLVRYMNTHYPLSGPSMIAARADDGPDPEYKKFASDFDETEEALAIASKNPENTAILARTNRLLAPLESTALEHGLKYHLLGRSGFWVQREIRKVIEKLSPFSGMPIETALNIVLPEVHKHYEVEDATAEDNSAIENLKALREIAARKPQPTSEFIAYANRCANVKKKGGITLSTVHQAKGREWGTVIVIGTAEGQLPHAKGNFDEEKRIFFVAISRAKDRLRITWCGRHSQFLNHDLSKEMLDKLTEECYSFEHIQKQLSLV